MAIPTVILPQLAEHFAARDISQLRRSFSMGVRSALFITAPLVAVLFIFRQPLIYLFLQRGAFDIQATACTALALTGYLGVFFESERLVILNTFYAMRDVITPLVTGSITFLLYILMAVPLSARFSFFGLGLAHSLACLAFSGINLVLLQRKLGGIEAKRIGACLSRVAIASFGAGLLMAGIYYSGRQCVTPRSFSSGILRLSFTFLSGAIAYLFFCWLLRLEELKQFYNTLVTYKQGILMKGQRSIKE
jgi:putative peptidoglycan lipid II flippase